jgi:hypothetical protein
MQEVYDVKALPLAPLDGTEVARWCLATVSRVASSNGGWSRAVA